MQPVSIGNRVGGLGLRGGGGQIVQLRAGRLLGEDTQFWRTENALGQQGTLDPPVEAKVFQEVRSQCCECSYEEIWMGNCFG